MLLDDLLKTNASIAEKYNIAKAKLENAHQAFINRLRETLYTKQTELQQERNRYEEERSKNRNLVMNAYRAWSLESKERLHSLTAEQYRADSRLKELRQWHPKEDDIKLVKEQLQQLDINEKANEEQQKTVRIQIEKLTNEFEMKEAELNKPLCRNKNDWKTIARYAIMRLQESTTCCHIWMTRCIIGCVRMLKGGKIRLEKL